MAGSSHFTVMTNIFVTEFTEFKETFRENSSVRNRYDYSRDLRWNTKARKIINISNYPNNCFELWSLRYLQCSGTTHVTFNLLVPSPHFLVINISISNKLFETKIDGKRRSLFLGLSHNHFGATNASSVKCVVSGI